MGGQGVFVKEIEAAPAATRDRHRRAQPQGHARRNAGGPDDRAVLPRADARDALVGRDGSDLAGLPEGARIGSDSRGAPCSCWRCDRTWRLRASAATSIRDYARSKQASTTPSCWRWPASSASGCSTARHSGILDGRDAAGGGSGRDRGRVPTRRRRSARAADSASTMPTTRAAADAERAFLRTLGAGCSLPVGAHATVDGGRVQPRSADRRQSRQAASPGGAGQRVAAEQVGWAWRWRRPRKEARA